MEANTISMLPSSHPYVYSLKILMPSPLPGIWIEEMSKTIFSTPLVSLETAMQTVIMLYHQLLSL